MAAALLVLCALIVCTPASVAAQSPVMTAPAPGTTGIVLTPTFAWTPVTRATAYYLYVGTAPGLKNVIDTGELGTTQYTPWFALSEGTTFYVRIYALSGGVWRYSDSTFTTAVVRAQLQSPAAGATGVALTPTFRWTTADSVQAYYLYVGTAPGLNNVVNTGEIGATQYTPWFSLPEATTLYVRLYTRVGGVWRSVDSTFTTATVRATLTAPAAGAPAVPLVPSFTWSSIAGADAYYLYVGSAPGLKDIVDTGEISATQYTPWFSLPEATTFYVRLYTRAGGVWRFRDSTFTTATVRATMLAPSSGATGVATLPTFSWSAISGAEAYYLYVGTSPGSKNIVDTGEVTAIQYTPWAALPEATTLYVRLHTRVGGVWRYTDSSFTTVVTRAQLLSPAAGATGVSLAPTFSWTSVSGAEAYYLYVGTSPGLKNVVDTGETASTHYTSWAALPDGVTLYARLYTRVAGAWSSSDASFTTVTVRPRFVVPAAAASALWILPTFEWTEVPGAGAYYLYVGTAPGLKDVIDTGEIAATSYVPGMALPEGQTLYARIYAHAGGTWYSTDTSFTTTTVRSRLTFPADGQANADLSTVLTWAAVPEAEAYYLCLGSTPGGSEHLDTGELAATSVAAPYLPSGETIHARLFTRVRGEWRFRDSTFTAAPTAATLTYPLNGSTNVTVRQPITWTTVPGAEAYYLYVGSVPGALDVVDSFETYASNYQPHALTPETTLYATLFTFISGVWRASPVVTFETGTLSSEILYPTRGSTGVTLDRPIAWKPVPDAAGYRLVLSTTPGGTDLLDTGLITETSYTVTSLPGSGPIFARVYTAIDDVQRFADSVFTLAPSVDAAEMVAPADGAVAVDTGLPFTWSAVSLAEAYRLQLGSAPGLSDLHDSGPLRNTRRFVDGIPASTSVYGTLSTRIAGVWTSRAFSFVSAASSSPRSAHLQAALDETLAVYRMAPLVGDEGVGQPEIAVPLADTLAAQQRAHPSCLDYSQQLITSLRELNGGLGEALLNVAMNPNHYDGHTLVEVRHPDTNEPVLLDPTFALTVTRTSDSGWATAEDVQAATQARSWGGLTFSFLETGGDAGLRNYYIDYPLLYSNVYHAGTGSVNGVGAPVLDLFEPVALPVSGTRARYALRCSGTKVTHMLVDGVDTEIDCSGVDGFSRIFKAGSVDFSTTTAAGVSLARPRRFVF